MRLTDYQRFIEAFRPTEQHVFHYSVVAERYFYLAEAQGDAFKVAIDYAFLPDHKHTISSVERYSYGFGVYLMLRTCLESAGRLNNYFEEKYSEPVSSFRQSWLTDVIRIINITNDLIKHPLEDASRQKQHAYEPDGSDSTGALTVYGYSVQDDEEMILPEIRPLRDLNLIRRYLDTMGALYLSLLPKQ